MEKKNKLIVLFFIIVLFALVSIIFINEELVSYSVLSLTFLAVSVIYFIYLLFVKTSKKDIYERKLRDILKTYDSIIVYSDGLAEINSDNLLLVSNFQDLVIAAEEYKGVIVYEDDKTSSAFILNNEDTTLIYLLKSDEKETTRIERLALRKLSETKKRGKSGILDDIDKTTIVKLKNNKKYKVSPIKKGTNK
jgi:hypothetical protein